MTMDPPTWPIVEPRDPTRPTVSREDTERLAEIYSSHARGYADSWGPVIRPMGRRLLEALPWDGARRGGDLGTGGGAHLPQIPRPGRGGGGGGGGGAPRVLGL